MCACVVYVLSIPCSVHKDALGMDTAHYTLAREHHYCQAAVNLAWPYSMTGSDDCKVTCLHVMETVCMWMEVGWCSLR